MKYNRIIIQNILETKFWDEIVQQVSQDVQNMDGDDYSSEFETDIDFLEFDCIEDIQVENYETEAEGDDVLVFGEMIIQADVNGFTYYDREIFSAGTALLTLIYSFSFREHDRKFDDLYLEHVD